MCVCSVGGGGLRKPEKLFIAAVIHIPNSRHFALWDLGVSWGWGMAGGGAGAAGGGAGDCGGVRCYWTRWSLIRGRAWQGLMKEKGLSGCESRVREFTHKTLAFHRRMTHWAGAHAPACVCVCARTSSSMEARTRPCARKRD